jgi:hypothetical protein
MPVRRQVAGEQLVDPGAAEIIRRQADAVHDDQLGTVAGGAVVAVRAEHLAHAGEQAGRDVHFDFATHGVGFAAVK